MVDDSSSVRRFAAIPTEYKGIRFRSRLEAKWAAFFDNVGWKWNYEPDDLHGWIPDFRFGMPTSSDVYVEVKPCSSIEELEAVDTDYRPRLVRQEMVCVFIGSNPVEAHGRLLIGSMAQSIKYRDSMLSYGCCWISIDVCQECGQLALNTSACKWSCGHDIPRAYYGDMWSDRDQRVRGLVNGAWAKAMNATQWKAPQ